MDAERFRHSPIGHLVTITGIDGRFARPYEHVAFVANPLRDEPALSSRTWRAVNEANRALARLDQASSQILNPELLRRPTLRREAQSTSALEGTFAPLEQVLSADVSDAAPSKELIEVLNYVEAADQAFESTRVGASMTVGLLEGVHKILVRGTEADTEDAGRIRTTPVAIGSPTGSIEDSRFVPMPPGIELRAASQDLVDWIKRTDLEREPIVAAAMAHYQFETLHPFNDGNGRIGRLLIVLQFIAQGLLREPLLSVSPWFEARRPQYQDELAKVSETGAWDSWVTFFASGIASSADDTARRVDRLLEVQRRFVQIVQDANGRGVVRDIVEILIGDPVVTVPMLTRRFDRTAPAVSTAVFKLVELGILSGPYGTYGRQYIAWDMWEAVTAGVGQVADRDAPLRAQRLR
ncbi:Fic family protein [Rathayibacter toxicus]|uniref:Fic family protein n=1 Tax=Rathayibacter toxicus TaxID=145458 RepID=A0A2S5Y8K8_9MICO|nr:Fic family protein [Rathayibacter toxicus]PPH24822.1 Fic family protein [Rathayibacter toxicus]PPH58747.1 Fic family protein [Rathayibacter toxicus]PPH60742.1 Fic family protein [Rathayibacter toxicus]PPH88562.1 Fic family protein [Rathayibacter toxicus]PPI16255.1 Fic family protein [Rathayibacter toxicus]